MNYIFDGVSLQNSRPTNMDSLLLKSGRIDDKIALLAVVCDGVGSLEEGAYASSIAVRMLNDWFNELSSIDCIGLKMRNTILDINFQIVSDTKKKNINTASTLSAVLLVESTYYIVHIGDSRVYSFQDNILSILTNDDVSSTGKLTAYIGKTENITLQYYEGVVECDFFLLCTDGLYKRMNVDFMIERIRKSGKRTLKKTIEALTQYVIKSGEKDNISLALVKIES